MKLKRLLTQLTLAGLLSAATAHADLVNVTADVTNNVTWHATNTYLLQTVVYVQSNAVLTIEPGTVVKGATNVATLIPRTDIPNLVSALWVTRGGKLYATGTVDRPIIMTFEGDNVNDPYDIPPTVTGQWGGVVLLGRGVLNSAKDSAGNVASPKYDVFEGTTGAGATIEHVFGGTDDADSSGALRYVSIRHPGTAFAPNSELNGLTMGAVGSGTEIEYVEVFASSDDAFEWWGGVVNTKHLVAAFCEDDDFDTDQGYRGTNQFWFGIKPPWQGSTDSRGFETDGDLNQTGYPGGNATPFSSWAVYNATCIGRGFGINSFGGGWGWNARDEARPNVFNSVFTEFNQGVLVDSDGINEFDTGVATLNDSVINVSSNATTANAAYLTTNGAYANTVIDPALGGVSYTNNLGLNPRPLPGSPLLTNVMTGAPTAVSYRGAFGPDDHWADGWTALSQLHYLGDGKPVINVTSDIMGNAAWYSTNTYLLQTVVYVQSNAVLTIEPGTVVKGATNVATLIPRTDIPNLVSALWVTRGGKLYATGAVDRPIIMTFEGDNVNDPYDIPPTVTGQWGGVVLLGRGLLNSAKDSAGNVASPKFDVFEGTTGAGATVEHVFGGTDDTDSSGALRYVSIRHPGTTFAPNSELNGLTMGAVGSGTEIEYVEVFASSDDAFEWWGGVVNTRHLVAAFCEDDDFDTDQGYRGTNQFWFGIKPPWQGSTDSRGFETDGDLNQTGYPGGNATPFSSWAVYNATCIGRGFGNNSFGGGWGWNARDEARPNVFNSVFTEFNQGVLVDSDGINEFDTGVATLKNSVINVSSNATTANAAYLTTNAAYANTVIDPALGGVSYTDNLGLNPRPLPGSPLLTNVMAGAPTAVSYRGAFGTDDLWAHKWTALYQLGYLSGTYSVRASVVLPNPAMLAATAAGGNLQITYLSQNALNYQLQSATNLSSSTFWADEGGAQTGTGGTLTNTVPASGARKYFRVLAH